MSKKLETQQSQSQPDNGNSNKAYSDYRSARRQNRRDSVNDVKGGLSENVAKFSSVAKYLNGKETKLLKSNLGLFEFPETWDMQLDDGDVKH